MQKKYAKVLHICSIVRKNLKKYKDLQCLTIHRINTVKHGNPTYLKIPSEITIATFLKQYNS